MDDPKPLLVPRLNKHFTQDSNQIRMHLKFKPITKLFQPNYVLSNANDKKRHVLFKPQNHNNELDYKYKSILKIRSLWCIFPTTHNIDESFKLFLTQKNYLF